MNYELSPKVRYALYVQSDHWRQLRAEKLQEHGYFCNRRKSDHRLQVHHMIYRERWEDALLSDLEVLCRRCHKSEHGIKSRKKDIKSKIERRRALRKIKKVGKGWWPGMYEGRTRSEALHQ